MSRFLDYFDLVIAISLPEREDRRTALRKNLTETGLAEESDIHWLSACRPDHAGGPPKGWTACKPAWGCLQSHLTALDLAMGRGVESVLVLEDDAHFSRHSPAMLHAFMNAVPGDWGQVYLGGYHARPQRTTAHPLVWEGGGVTTTHAYAVSRRAMQAVHDRLGDMSDYLANKAWHCDSHLALAHARKLWPVYTPSWWLAAQDESMSDINGKPWPRRWHHSPAWRMELPFILVEDAEALSEAERAVLLFHPSPMPEKDNVPALLPWMHAGASRALAFGTLPALTRAQAPAEEVLRRLWPAGIITHPGADLPALADYPFNGLFPHPMTHLNGGPAASRN